MPTNPESENHGIPQDLRDIWGNLNPQQRTLLQIAGLAGAAAMVAAFRSEKFQQLLQEAGDATSDLAKATGTEVWDRLKQEIPDLGAKVTQRFGEQVINPFIDGLLEELKPKGGVATAVAEAISAFRRLRGPHPLEGRLSGGRIVDANPPQQQ